MRYILIFLFLFSCTNKGLIKTNQKNIYLSNNTVSYDVKKESFKIDFSINNNTDKTLTNFVYQVIFKDKNGNVITTKEDFHRGAIEPEKAKRATLYIDEFTRKNFSYFEIEIKK